MSEALDFGPAAFDLPGGFLIRRTSFHTTRDEAERIMLSDRSNTCTSISLNGDDAVFVQHLTTCPHCGGVIPAYPRYFSLRGSGEERATPEEAEAFLGHQQLLWERCQAGVLKINSPLERLSYLICPLCGVGGRVSRRTLRCEVAARQGRVTLGCELDDVNEMRHLPFRGCNIEASGFPLREVLVFDVAGAAAHVELNDGDSTLFSRPVVQQGIFNKDDPCIAALNDASVRAALKAAFEAVSGGPIAFSTEELNLFHLLELCRFVGYNAEFYNAIPYYVKDRRRGEIGEDFSEICTALHYAADMPKLYEQQGLPRCKSVRRLIFETPGFMFYCNELKQIWDILGDPNYMCAFLKDVMAFRILPFLRSLPGTFEYVRMVRETKGKGAVVRCLSDDLESYKCYYYCAMSDDQKQRVRAAYLPHTGRKKKEPEIFLSDYSVPMPTGEIGEYRAGNFVFSCLRSTGDCNEASEEMNNCLWSYGPDEGIIVGVRRGGRYTAAINIYKGRICETATANNGDLEEDPELYEAYCEWRDRLGLTDGKRSGVRRLFEDFEH